LLVAYGTYTALPAFSRSGFVFGLTQLATMTLPFVTVAVYAFRGGPTWLWNVAFIVNLLLMLGALAIGVLGFTNSSYASMLSVAPLAGMLPFLNLAFLLYRASRTPPAAKTSVVE